MIKMIKNKAQKKYYDKNKAHHIERAIAWNKKNRERYNLNHKLWWRKKYQKKVINIEELKEKIYKLPKTYIPSFRDKSIKIAYLDYGDVVELLESKDKDKGEK